MKFSDRLRSSFAAHTIHRAGFRKGSDVLTFCLSWITVHADLGHRPTVDEYAAWWQVSVSTAYREQATFRECWPEFLTPSDVALALGLDPVDPHLPMPTIWGDPLAVGS